MTVSILAKDTKGNEVNVELSAIRGLSPDTDTMRTQIFLDDEAVIVETSYETLIERFSAMWPKFAL